MVLDMNPVEALLRSAIGSLALKAVKVEEARKRGSVLLGKLLIAKYGSLRKAAEVVGYDQGNLSTVVHGKRTLTWESMVRLSTFLDEGPLNEQKVEPR